MDTPADITKAAASHIEMTQAGDDRKAIDADAGDLMAATIKMTKLSHFSCASLQFYGFLAVVYCNSWGNGFDSSLFGALNSNTRWHAHFNVPLSGSALGVVTAMITIGSMVGSFAAGPSADRYGRRFGMFLGSAIVVLAAILMSAGNTRGSFLAGRFFAGLGGAICSSAGSSWVTESSPPQWRGPTTLLFNSLYLPGAIIASAVGYAAGKIDSDLSWRLPVIIQIVPAALVVFFVWFLPESPRWLISNDRHDEARKLIAKYHAAGDEHSPVVALQMMQMNVAISQSASDKRWYDYSEFFNTRSNRYRLFLVVSMGFIGQWGGSDITSYYLANVLRSIGITSQARLLLFNLGYYLAAFGGALIGTSTSNYFGRRQLLLFGILGMAVIIAGLAACTSQYRLNEPASLSNLTIAFIFFNGICHAGAINPLVIAYPAEVLHTNTRAKGMGVNGFSTHVAELVNTYAIPIGLKAITWRLYIVYAGWNLVQAVWVYIFFVEPKGHTLEEMDTIFESKHPVKESLRKHLPADRVLSKQDTFEEA